MKIKGKYKKNCSDSALSTVVTMTDFGVSIIILLGLGSAEILIDYSQLQIDYKINGSN